MKNFVVIFCIALLFFSCQKEISKPNPFIEQAKMEDILYDVALLYGMQTTNSFASDTVKKIQMKDVFEKYNIDSLTFTENNHYYVLLKKGVYFDMQNRVIERLKKEKERIDSLLPTKQLEVEALRPVMDTLLDISVKKTEEIAKEKEEPVLKKDKAIKKSVKAMDPERIKKMLEPIDVKN